MKQHIFLGIAAPVTAPTELGHHFVDTVAKKIYFSVGTSLPSDWKSTDESNLIQNAINPGVIDKAPSQDAVYNALNAASAMIPFTISSDLTILSGFGSIRPKTKVASGIKLKIQNNSILKII